MTIHDPITAKRRDLIGAGQEALTSFQREFERLHDDFNTGLSRMGVGAISPRVDICETDKGIEITAELPGLEEKDIEVSVAGDVLTIKGEKTFEAERKDRNYWFGERAYGSILRRLALPEGVDAETVKATMAKGVLTVTMDKPAKASARKIEVKPA
ncbi:MAG: Hsp20/alpha crystallin family protein [Proteobacteria bacterium]|nr:Hsp20/alpha crystallin family protein [Pseudomonadota bacterium]